MNEVIQKKAEEAIYNYGIYPVLFILRELEEQQQFEYCHAIKQAIDRVRAGREHLFGTKCDDYSLEEELKSVLRDRTNPDLFMKNMPHYIEKAGNLILS